MQGRRRVVWLVLAVAGLVAVLSGCSSKGKPDAPFCAAMGDSSQLFGQLNIDGTLDVQAFKDGLADLERLAPDDIQPQMRYLAKVYDAYFEVGDQRMTHDEFDKRFPAPTIQAKRADVNTWMLKHCGFGMPN